MSKKSLKKKKLSQRLDTLRNGLHTLCMLDMRNELDAMLDQDEALDETTLVVLERLIEAQLRARQERGIKRRIKAARFPATKTLDEFDFDFQTGVDRAQIMRLATLDFIKKRRSLLFAGMSGTGKSHLAIALGHLACVEGYRVAYTTSAKMLSTLHLAHTTETLGDALKKYVRPALLIIDEVGLDRPERQRTNVDDAGLFYKVIAARYEATLSTIITTNIPWDAWGDYLGDTTATAAVLDRLVHHGYAISNEGPSYRAEQHKVLNTEDSQVGH